jgi:hypothetical protein
MTIKPVPITFEDAYLPRDSDDVILDRIIRQFSDDVYVFHLGDALDEPITLNGDVISYQLVNATLLDVVLWAHANGGVPDMIVDASDFEIVKVIRDEDGAPISLHRTGKWAVELVASTDPDVIAVMAPDERLQLARIIKWATDYECMSEYADYVNSVLDTYIKDMKTHLDDLDDIISA